jgi:Lon protease-like protein
MAPGPFDPRYEDLPSVLPVFPLAGVLLLPHGKLPLNIFERRYLAMTRDALKGERLIGMIQPTGRAETPKGPALFPTGCVGRLVSFAETDDGRYLITLNGVIRFRIKEELDLVDGYRRVVPDFTPFQGDMADAEQTAGENGRARILTALEQYFRANNVSANWDAIRKMDDVMLVTTLAMSCPFDPADKQALLESGDLPARAQVLATLLEMGSVSPANDDYEKPPTRH